MNCTFEKCLKPYIPHKSLELHAFHVPTKCFILHEVGHLVRATILRSHDQQNAMEMVL